MVDNKYYLKIDNSLTKNVIYEFIKLYDPNNSSTKSENKPHLLQSLINVLTLKKAKINDDYFITFFLINVGKNIYLVPLHIDVDYYSANEATITDNSLTWKSLNKFFKDDFESLTINDCDFIRSHIKQHLSVDTEIDFYNLLEKVIDHFSSETNVSYLVAELSEEPEIEPCLVNKKLTIQKSQNIKPHFAVNNSGQTFNKYAKIADYKESSSQDPSEWYDNAVIMLKLNYYKDSEMLGRLIPALNDEGLRSAVINDLKKSSFTLNNFNLSFLKNTQKDKTIYLREINTLSFNDEKDTVVKFFCQLQKLTCKSLD